MSNIGIYVISRVCLSGWPAIVSLLSILHGKSFHVGHQAQTFQPNSFIPAVTSSILYHFSHLDHGKGSQGQHKTKTLGLISEHTVDLIRIKLGRVM